MKRTMIKAGIQSLEEFANRKKWKETAGKLKDNRDQKRNGEVPKEV